MNILYLDDLLMQFESDAIICICEVISASLQTQLYIETAYALTNIIIEASNGEQTNYLYFAI